MCQIMMKKMKGGSIKINNKLEIIKGREKDHKINQVQEITGWKVDLLINLEGKIRQYQKLVIIKNQILC